MVGRFRGRVGRNSLGNHRGRGTVGWGWCVVGRGWCMVGRRRGTVGKGWSFVGRGTVGRGRGTVSWNIGIVGRGGMDGIHTMSNRSCMDPVGETMVGKGSSNHSMVASMD